MPFVRQHTSAELLREASEGGAMMTADDGRGAYGAGRPERYHMPRADVVMVFPYKVDARVKWGDAEFEESTRGLRPATEVETHKMESWQTKRTMTVHALSDSGLVLMLYYSRDRDEVFVRIAADETHLRQVAEMRRYQLELKPQFLSAFADYKNDYVGRRELNYSDRCVVSHIYKAHVDIDDNMTNGSNYPRPDAIFRTTDRIRLIDYIVRTSDHNCSGVDVGQLMHDGDLLHYFPLHEHRKLKEMDANWFKCFAWGTQIDKVRDYFGERIALYFLFMAHLNFYLVPATALGLVLFLLDMCFGTPDNFTAVISCLGMGVWATLFTHFWRRTAATHVLKWGTLGMGRQLEPTRPEFIGTSSINPVTGRVDRYFPWSQRIWRVMFSYSVLTCAVLSLVFVIMVLFWLRHAFHRNGGRFVFQVINAIFVELMNTIFTSVAKTLTDKENHRAYSEHANHLLAKTVIFKFINCYISLYYIAFLKKHSYLFGYPIDCVAGDCLNDLGSQLAIFMITRLTLQNCIEICWPYCTMAYRNYMEGRQFHTSMFTNPLTVMPDLSTAEKQSKKEDYDLYEDMDEVLILYGYTTLFVVACPWVPFLALLSSLLECFLDHKKLILLYRRPWPTPAANNEPWDTAFDVFGMLAMITNAAVLVFTSELCENMTSANKILLFLAIEHGMVFLRVVTSLYKPALPDDVKLLRLQQQVMVHRHLNLGGEEDDHETRANAMMTAAAPPPPIYDQDDDEDEW